MDIWVLMKQTFDTEEKVIVQNGKIQEDGVKFIINPYDEYAIEEALKLREAFGGVVTVVTAGSSRAEEALRTALAMGADQAMILDDPSLLGDEYTISKALAAAIRKHPYDLILAGNMSVDNGAGQVAPRVAEELGIAQITTVTGLSIENGTATAVRDVEGDLETVEVALPVLITAQQGLNEPRYPSLPGIMKAKKKPLTRLSAVDLGLNPEEKSAKTAATELFMPPKKQAGRVLSGDLSVQVTELVQLLRQEAKVI